jgi:hypothetical protein
LKLYEYYDTIIKICIQDTWGSAGVDVESRDHRGYNSSYYGTGAGNCPK